MTLEKTNHSAFTLRRTEAGDTCDLFFRFLPLNAHLFITRTVHRGGAQPLSLFRSLETLNMEPETSHHLLIFTYKLLPIVSYLGYILSSHYLIVNALFLRVIANSHI